MQSESVEKKQQQLRHRMSLTLPAQLCIVKFGVKFMVRNEKEQLYDFML